MKERAYAKINLCLDVIRRREDGYHDLRMIMVPLDFYDVLEMVPAEKTTLSINRSWLPVNDKNTVIKAINVMKETYGFDQNYACVLQKHIPSQAGLAGGSADAAAAIRIMNRLQNLHMTRDDMIAIGKQIGADVPFCTVNRPSVVEGIGERITPFQNNLKFHVLLVKPHKGVSTKKAFEGIDFKTVVHPDPAVIRDAMVTNDYDALVNGLGNSLEEVSMNLVPEIRDIKQDLLDLGFDGALMSGSGSTVFGITRNAELLKHGADAMHEQGYFTRMTRIL
ncbi:MAG: 4-(cytidine 5'-diphospho)-2-C-methyl-D-erythritol kinase [Bulleidia sp.]|nr:4-(cytidine 5'-diphospho)-2-C-methyl-D-erythritol kinase [Bulleidia sp.]